MYSNIKNMTDEVLGGYLDLVATYHDLHSHPELSFEEWQTAERISLRLRGEGIEHRSIAQTGILAKIEGSAEGADLHRAIVLRADIDALPIREENTTPHASAREGVMHACGHDMHTTILLGTLGYLNRHREELGCTIFGLFQPGEELNPGGAKLVLDENPFEGYEVVAVVGNHIEPTLPTGTIGICEGKYMAACDELHFTLVGKGGHAALREKIVDPILPTAHLIEALYAIPASAPEGAGQTIISIGKIEAAGATNIVPNEVHLEGTMRSFDEAWRREIKERIGAICKYTEGHFGVTIHHNFGSGYPAVYNTPSLAQSAKALLGEVFGVVELGLRPTGEDFGYYTERYPSLFYRLGVGYEGEEFAAQKAGSLHTPTLLPDTRAIGLGVVAMTLLALDIQKQNRDK